ncbi:hypothetical protein [Nocardia wallacei]|uniref:hypothetical protein n=1 Tax=Nocardia wallacei TaxID=480035 RepID=UPI0024567E3E|nr:hypothetical protein [Nocardia wallacei]
MTVIRLLLALGGVAAAWYGVTLLAPMNAADLRSVATWFVAGILLHDFVFAPLCAAVGVTMRRLLPPARWSPPAYGATCTVTLLLVAVPVIDRRHAIAGNPTVVDRPYAVGLAVALAVIWAVVAIALLRGRRSAIKR